MHADKRGENDEIIEATAVVNNFSDAAKSMKLEKMNSHHSIQSDNFFLS